MLVAIWPHSNARVEIANLAIRFPDVFRVLLAFPISSTPSAGCLFTPPYQIFVGPSYSFFSPGSVAGFFVMSGSSWASTSSSSSSSPPSSSSSPPWSSSPPSSSSPDLHGSSASCASPASPEGGPSSVSPKIACSHESTSSTTQRNDLL